MVVGLLWNVAGRCGLLWDHCGIVAGLLWIVVDRCGLLWIVVGRSGSFWVLVTTICTPPWTGCKANPLQFVWFPQQFTGTHYHLYTWVAGERHCDS